MSTAMKEQQVQDKIVTYNGRKWVKSETDTDIILTSVEVKKGKKQSVLMFTKDVELSNQIEKEVTGMIKKSIISNYFNG